MVSGRAGLVSIVVVVVREEKQKGEVTSWPEADDPQTLGERAHVAGREWSAGDFSR